MFPRIVIYFARRYWDDLWGLVLANLWWFLFSLPVVTLPAATLAQCHYIGRLLYYRGPTFGDFVRAFRRHLLPGFLYAVMVLGLFVILVVNLKFYMSLAAGGKGWLMLPAGATAWGLVLLAASQIYAIPLLASGDRRPWRALWQGFLLVVARPGVTLLLIPEILLLMLFAVIMPIFLPSSVLTLSLVATMVVTNDYPDDKPDAPEGAS